MRGLVEADLAAARQAKGRFDPPGLLCHLGAVDVLGLERPDEPESAASNLVAGDYDLGNDVFLFVP